MAEKTVNLDDLVSLCKRRGFIFPGSDVYGGMAGTWDYGPLGVMLKRKIMQTWWKYWVEDREDMFGVDAAIIMNPKTWVASGHTATFSDPLVECGSCHGRFRADKIVDPKTGKNFDATVTKEQLNSDGAKCPTCGKTDWGEVRPFNMMFSTHVGAVLPEDIAESANDSKSKGSTAPESANAKKLVNNSTAYLRPETAQGIFTNYKNVVDTLYPDLPFGLAQQGKAFRNEISPRDFVFRSREFEQMEIEYFVNPETWEENFEKLLMSVHDFLENVIGLPASSLHEEEVAPEGRAHYSKRTIDMNFDYPIGSDEIMGIAYRTDFDLGNIARESGKKMEYRDKTTGKVFTPHVIEPSFGVERLIMAVLTTAYTEEEIPAKTESDTTESADFAQAKSSAKSETRIVLKLPENLAPYRFCVSPLLKNKPELVEKAKAVYAQLRKKYGNVTWDDSGNIGKRYRKQDEIGTPKCVVIDFDTLTDDTVTVRDRDTMEQTRVKIEEL